MLIIYTKHINHQLHIFYNFKFNLFYINCQNQYNRFNNHKIDIFSLINHNLNNLTSIANFKLKNKLIKNKNLIFSFIKKLYNE